MTVFHGHDGRRYFSLLKLPLLLLLLLVTEQPELSVTMPGKGAIFTNANLTEEEKIQNSVDLAPAAAEEEEPVEAAEEVEDHVYISGYLMKLGEHLFAGYSKRFELSCT